MLVVVRDRRQRQNTVLCPANSRTGIHRQSVVIANSAALVCRDWTWRRIAGNLSPTGARPQNTPALALFNRAHRRRPSNTTQIVLIALPSPV